MGSIVGDKGAISIFRFAGKRLGKKLAAGKTGTVEDARSLVAKFFLDKEFMDAVDLAGDHAALSGCRIGLVLADRGVHPGAHSLCHFGFGLIDGVTEAVTGKKIVTLHESSELHAEGVHCKEKWG